MTPGTKWVQRLLEEHGLKATHLARMAGIAPSTLLRALGSTKPYTLSNDSLRKVAKALKTQVPYGILADESSWDDDTRRIAKIILPEGRVYISIPTELSDASRQKVELLFASMIDAQA